MHYSLYIKHIISVTILLYIEKYNEYETVEDFDRIRGKMFTVNFLRLKSQFSRLKGNCFGHRLSLFSLYQRFGSGSQQNQTKQVLIS